MATGRSADGLALATESLTTLHYVGVAAATVTGALHLYLVVLFGTSPMGVSFLLAGVGFFAGAGAVLVGYRRRLVYLLGVPFTLFQVAAWYVVNAPDFSTLGYVDKVAQLVLVAVLVALYRRE